MSRASGCLWLVVGLILALVAGGIAYITLQRATTTQTAVGPAETVAVVVAARQVAAGTMLTAADLVMQTVPTTILPTGTLSDTLVAAGMVTMVPLNTGEILLAHHLTKPDITGQNLGFTLAEGKVAITMAAADLLSRGQLIETGSRVDILYSLEVTDNTGAQGGEGTKKQVTFGTLQGVTIVSVLRSGGAESAKSDTNALGVGGGTAPVAGLGGVPYAYILALDSQDALVLKYLRDAGAIMDLALRNVADESEHPTQPVDLPYVIDKYQLPAR
ncbi:MAG: Flp pilus assembly protein CpaB [Chloroflexi bacterium]|nr:Flp pilus assembly protein CpaB [Chloroflexota bacterium]